MICPCKDCEFRHFLCHAECEPYRMWREEKRVAVEKAGVERISSEFLIDQIKKQKAKTNKKRK